jgi:hypothetical protein
MNWTGCGESKHQPVIVYRLMDIEAAGLKYEALITR